MKRIGRKSSAVLVVLSIIIISVMVFSVGCVKKEEKEIRIGAILPLTGDAAAYGIRLKEGIELAKYSLEKQYKNPKINILFEDSKISPKEAVNAFYKLEQTDHVKFFIGPYSSGEVLAIAPIAEKNKVLVLSPGASSPKVTDAGDYIFRIVASDIYDGKVIAQYAKNELKASTVGIIYINNDYGVGINSTFQREFEALQGSVLVSSAFEPNKTDFRTNLIKLKKANPDAIILIGFKEMGFFLKQMGEMGLSFTVLTTGLFENPDIVNIAGKFAENVIYTMPYFDINGNDNVVAEFRKTFSELFPNKQPSIEHALGYDSLNVLFHALMNSDSSVENVKKNLYKTSNFSGVAGSITFDKNGDVIKPYGIKQYKNGAFSWVIPIYKM